MRRLCFFLSLPLLFAACGPDTPPEPLTTADEPAADSLSAKDVAGRYRLKAVNDEALPGGVGTAEGCEVQLTEGSIELDEDATYALDVLARAICDDDDESQMMDRATSEGPYTVEGLALRFFPEPAEEPEEGEDEGDGEPDETPEEPAEEEKPVTPELYDARAFAGEGALRDSLLTVRLDDGVTTLSFVKE